MNKSLMILALAGGLILTACPHQVVYTVTEEQFNAAGDYDEYIKTITDLNFTVSVMHTFDSSDRPGLEHLCKYDNGKVYAWMKEINTKGEIIETAWYIDFKAGTYNPEKEHWNYDLYYIDEGGETIKEVYEDYDAPEVLYFPSYRYYGQFSEYVYQEDTFTYVKDRFEEAFSATSVYIYSDITIKFEDGNCVFMSYNEEKQNVSGSRVTMTLNISDYGRTSVKLPTQYKDYVPPVK